MGRFNDDYKPNMKEKARACTNLSTLNAIDWSRGNIRQAPFAAWPGIIVTLQFRKRMVVVVSIGHQMQRRVAPGMAITPWLVHNMLRQSGVTGA